MPSLGNFLHTQLIAKIPVPATSFASKTVIITGANTGLGKEAARHVARLGASKLIIACRSTSKGNSAKLEIESSVKCKPDVIEVWELDIESPASVQKFVERANQLPRLDVLINNAGIQTINYQVVYDTERTLAVNNIGTFLLALQLVPKLKETAKNYETTPHLTFTGSALYDVAKFPENYGDNIFDWYGDESHSSSMNQYNLSKLILLYAIIKLASIVNSDVTNPIVVNTLDPCFCKTGLPGQLHGVLKVFMRVFEALFARTSEEGSRLVVIAASAGKETNGKYMRAGAVQEYAPFITDKAGVEKTNAIWEQLGQRLEKLQPGIMQHVNTF